MNLKDIAKIRCQDAIITDYPLYRQINVLTDALAQLLTPEQAPNLHLMRDRISELRDQCNEFEVLIDNGQTPTLDYQ